MALAELVIRRVSIKLLKPIETLESQSRKIAGLLDERRAHFALIGGIAVSFRAVERTTKDVDLAVAVENDAEAEALVRSLSVAGYLVETVVEQENAERLSTVRLISRGDFAMFVDLLFASSGIESEVVATAEKIEIFPGLVVPVATVSSLIALKVLSANEKNRLQDILDLQHLIDCSTPTDLESARELLSLITERGFNRNKNLLQDLDDYIERFNR